MIQKHLIRVWQTARLHQISFVQQYVQIVERLPALLLLTKFSIIQHARKRERNRIKNGRCGCRWTIVHLHFLFRQITSNILHSYNKKHRKVVYVLIWKVMLQEKENSVHIRSPTFGMPFAKSHKRASEDVMEKNFWKLDMCHSSWHIEVYNRKWQDQVGEEGVWYDD